MPTPESQFAEFRASGSAAALAAVFDTLAPELLLVAAHVAPRGVEPEDVVQDTFLDAIARAASWDATRPLLPWMIGILVRNARALARADNRRPDPARLTSRPAPQTPLEESAATELAVRVRHALEELPRHYRQVLALHVVHGLTPAEIAHSLDCPAATVRTRLQRGLERLRALLPAGIATGIGALLSGRGLAAARRVVLERASATALPTTTAATLATGVLIMTKLLLGAGIALAAAAVWIFWPVADVATGTLSEAAARVAATSAVAASSAGRDMAPEPPASSAFASAKRSPTTGGLRAEFMWAEDGAAAGALQARVERVETAGESDRRWLTSGSDGVLELSALRAGRYRVTVFDTIAHEADVHLGAVATLRVALQPRVDLGGIVVDADGVPVADAEVRTQGDKEATVLAITGNDGRFRWRGDRVMQVWAQRDGWVPSTMEFVFEGRVEKRLVLAERGIRLAGSVVGPDDVPVPGALVVLSTESHAMAAGLPDTHRRGPIVLRSDARGAFASASLAAGEQTAVAVAAGFGPAVQAVTVADGAPLVIRLCHGTSVTGVVRQGDVPRAGVLVWAAPRPASLGVDPLQSILWVRATSDSEGRYELRGLLPGNVRVTAQPRGLPPLSHDLEGADGAQLTWNPVLTEGLAVRGTVVDDAGAPLAGWHVYTDAGRARPLSTQTDSAGRFALEGLQPSLYCIDVAPPTAGTASTLPWARGTARAGEHDLVLRVRDRAASGGYLTGRIMGADGRVPALSTITVDSGMPQDERIWRQSVGPDGSFRLGPLPPGRWQVQAALPDQTPTTLSPSPVLAPGATLDVGTLTFAPKASFTAVLRHEDGTLVREARVVLEGRNHTGPLTRLADGAWRAEAVPLGAYELRAWGQTFAALVHPVTVTADSSARTEITVAPGTLVRFVVRVATADRAGERLPPVFFSVNELGRGLVLSGRCEPDRESSCVATCGFSAGEYSFHAGFAGTKSPPPRAFVVPVPQTSPIEVEFDLTAAAEDDR